MITRKAKNTAIALVAALLIVALAVVCTVTGIKNDPLSQYLQTVEWPQKLPYAYSEEYRRLQDQILDCFEQYRAPIRRPTSSSAAWAPPPTTTRSII